MDLVHNHETTIKSHVHVLFTGFRYHLWQNHTLLLLRGSTQSQRPANTLWWQEISKSRKKVILFHIPRLYSLLVPKEFPRFPIIMILFIILINGLLQRLSFHSFIDILQIKLNTSRPVHHLYCYVSPLSLKNNLKILNWK